jgi:hypothetical protein
MNELSRWLATEAKREGRAVYLEEALLGNRFWAYAYYRLRYFFVRYAVASATHAVTVLLLYRFFDRTHFVIVLVAYAVASVVSAWWWGSLEALRTDVRRLYRLRAPHAIPKSIGNWLSLSLQLTLLTALGTLAWLVFELAHGESFKPAQLYVVAIGLRLSLQFFTRAYHTGIYAIRRIYRPLPAIIGVEFVGITATIVLAPLLGAWALPTGALLGIGTVTGLSLYYSRRAYWFLGLSPRPFVQVTGLHLPPRRSLRDFLGGGFSYALIALDSLLVLVLFTTERGVAGETSLFALFFLLAPTVRASSEWAQLMYFDLKRLEIRLFRNLKTRFERKLLRLAVVLGVLFSAVAIVVGMLVYPVHLGLLAFVLLPFFVSISLLAVLQIEAYSERSYAVLMTNAALCLVGYVAAARAFDHDAAIVLMLAAVSFACFLLLLLRRETLEGDSDPALLWPTGWLAELRAIQGPVRVAAARFYPDQTVENDDWRQRHVGEQMARFLRRRGRATLVESGLLVWYERGADGQSITERSLPGASGGLLSWVGSAFGNNGLEALQAAARSGLLGREVERVVTRSGGPRDVEELRSTFGRMFTSGIVYAPDEPIPAKLDALPGKDKRAAVADAVAFARHLRSQRPRSRYEATAVCVMGELRVVFLVSRRAPRHLRSRWEALVRRYNLQAAVAPASPAQPTGSRVRAYIRETLDTRVGVERRSPFRVRALRRSPEPVAASRVHGTERPGLVGLPTGPGRPGSLFAPRTRDHA